MNIKIGNIDIQFGPNWDSVKANQLVQSLQQVIGAVRTLANAQSSTTDNPTIAVHELAGEAGLGIYHTVHGLEVGQVLIATAADSAHFGFLRFEQIFDTDPTTFAAPAQGDVITFHDGFWSALPSTAFTLTDPGIDAIAMWDMSADGGAGGLAWALGGVGIKITSGRIAVDDTQLVHGHLLGLLADDHPQYALLAAPNTWGFLQTFAAGILVNGALTLNGNLEQSGQEPEQYIQNTDDIANEGAWRMHAEPGQLIFSTVWDDGSDGENWFSITRIGELADAINLQSNSFTWNGSDVLTDQTLAAGVNIYFTRNAAGKLVLNSAVSTGGGGSLTVTDGTHTVAGTTQITFSGLVVSGSSPNAVVTGTPGTNGIDGQDGLDGQDGEDGQDGFDGINASALIQQRGASWSNGLLVLATPINDVPLVIAEDCTIQDLTILTNGGVGSCAIDIWRIGFAGYPPTVANTIISGSSYPTISAGRSLRDTSLAGFSSTTLSKGDTVVFHLRSSSIFTEITIMLSLKRVGDLSTSGYTDARAQNAVTAILSNAGNVQFTVVPNVSIRADIGTNSSVTSPGYRVNPDGSIDQWGTVNIPASGGITVSFPLVFPTGAFVVNLTPAVTTNGTPYLTGLSASNFTCDNSAGATPKLHYWHAIGH